MKDAYPIRPTDAGERNATTTSTINKVEIVMVATNRRNHAIGNIFAMIYLLARFVLFVTLALTIEILFFCLINK